MSRRESPILRWTRSQHLREFSGFSTLAANVAPAGNERLDPGQGFSNAVKRCPHACTAPQPLLVRRTKNVLIPCCGRILESYPARAQSKYDCDAIFNIAITSCHLQKAMAGTTGTVIALSCLRPSRVTGFYHPMAGESSPPRTKASPRNPCATRGVNREDAFFVLHVSGVVP